MISKEDARPTFFFDARYIRIDHHDGISRFSVGLCSELSKLVPLTAMICDLRQLESLPTGVSWVMLNTPTSIKEIFIAWRINKLGARVVYSPMQTIGSFGRKFRLILTLHDLIYYRHPAPPSGFSAPIRLLWRLYHLTYLPQRWLLNRADEIVTVSNTTKRLIHAHRLTKRPVTVVANAAGNATEQESLRVPTQRPASNRLVYMGSFMGYKNVETLISGMRFLPDYELRLLSKVGPKRLEELTAIIPENARVTFLNGVSDETYHLELDSSVALVSASLDEGFGIPIVEAGSRGIPTVLSNLEIFNEIAGDAAVYFESSDPLGFADAVQKIAGNTDWMQRSRAMKLAATRYNWNLSAASLLPVVKRLEEMD